MKTSGFCLTALAAAALACAQPLPITGIAHAAFSVSDMDQARGFYGKLLGFEEPFIFRDDAGKTQVAFFKINDRQFIEIRPDLKPGQNERLEHICFESSDVRGLHKRMEEMGLKPGKIESGRARNEFFSLWDPEGNHVEFLQYLPGSMHVEATGKALGANRVSTRLMHGGLKARDYQKMMAFWRDTLGFVETWRGGSRDGVTSWINLRVPNGTDYIELMLYEGQPTRTQLGSMQHICLEVPRIQEASTALTARGLPSEPRHFPRVGRNQRWQVNTFDPDGSRTEVMEPERVNNYLSEWRSVADRLLEVPAGKWIWDWGEGVQMIGMMKIFERTGDRRYADYVEAYAATHLPKGKEELLLLNKEKIPQPGFCGRWSPSTALLYLHRARGNPEHLRFAEETAEFILKQAQRSPEGGFGHWLGNHQYWVDTLYMEAPLLSALKQPEESARQVEIFAKHLQDPKTGLYYHMWDWDKDTHTPALWGRGNGWVLMSIADTLEMFDKANPLYKRMQALAESQLKGLRATQDADGLWHTVLDDPKSYPETSATAMVVYGTLKLIRLGAIPDGYSGMARRAWMAINEKYVKAGLVTGVSAGTVPKGTDYYRNLPLGTETWGTGSYLMAGSEVDRAVPKD